METISISACSTYDLPELRAAVERLLAPIGGISAFVNRGERILLKPNLLSAKEPAQAVTTHPHLVQVVAELVSKAGGIVLIGDSPGLGSFSRVTEKSGMKAAAAHCGATLVEFSDAVEVKGGGTFRSIFLAREYYESDKVINLPKLKTHEMMTMTCAVKNLFGAVVGAEKASWHLKAGTSRDLFARLLLEIYQLKKPTLNIVDGILAMEGNGPGNGDPIERHVLIAGENPVAVDVIAGRIAGIPADLLHVEREAARLGLPGAQLGDIDIKGVQLPDIPVIRFKLPGGLDTNFGLPKFLANALKKQLTTFPAADQARCILCGHCRDACPPQAITIKNSALSVDNARCIRCWCCRELCPHDALKIKKGTLLTILALLSGKNVS